jgi:hypothetical protein
VVEAAEEVAAGEVAAGVKVVAADKPPLLADKVLTETPRPAAKASRPRAVKVKAATRTTNPAVAPAVEEVKAEVAKVEGVVDKAAVAAEVAVAAIKIRRFP